MEDSYLCQLFLLVIIMKFPEYKQLDMPAQQASLIQKWQKEATFERSVTTREDAPSFVFFEGPPSANGMPGIHHVMARSIKDVICRYKTQKGFRVERRAGWDTHGLPVELGVEKMLGITKEDIGKTVSVEEYNSACRKEVMKYTKEWEQLTEKMGYWVDMSRPYVTYHNSYIETLWYLLKDIYKKGWLYKGYSIQPYSPAAGTGLSTHELNQPGCYKDVKDTTCVAQFAVLRDSSSAFLFDSDNENVSFVAWTTTPWTLPSNTALCVGPAIEYVKVSTFNPYTGTPVSVVLAKELVDRYFNPRAAGLPMDAYKQGDKLIPFRVSEKTYKGNELCGIRYSQLLKWVNPGEGAFRVITGDFVTTEDGTGIVHIAPTFGDDDNKVAKAYGVPPMILLDKNGGRCPMVDRVGRFYRLEDLDPDFVNEKIDVHAYGEFAGRYVKNAYDPALSREETDHSDAVTLDIDICMWLKQKGLVFKIEKMVHNYPHCWRTDKPVLYYPLDSWFIRTTAVKDRMMELNDTVNWKPESTGTGRFGKWLENLQDWNLSRSRFWGTPLPIWRTEDGKEELCVGSLEELYQNMEKAVSAGITHSNPMKDAGFVPGDFSKENYDRIDLHRPFVDRWVLVSESGKPMYREPDLIDVWFDSGAMPFAQEGLAALGRPEFGQVGDFIAEGVDQTRGWFFTLHAIATMVNNRVCFRNVLSNGLVLDKAGNKMSKRLGNAVDPFKVLDAYGADPLRWYMLTNAQPWDNLKFDEAGVDEVRRKFFGTLYNTYSFFALYANVDGFTAHMACDTHKDWVPVKERPEIDRWVISLLNTLIEKVDNAYADYDITTAGRLIQDFVCDQLSNWYVRLNRKRFWGGEMDRQKYAAYQTLYTCLQTVACLAAPIAPFFMEQMYLDLLEDEAPQRTVADAPSVHLSSMPASDPSLIDKMLEERMDLAQRCSSMILALRRKVNIKVRQPLSKVLLPVLDARIEEQLTQVKSLILNEVNVKELEYVYDTTGLILKQVKPNFKVLGKKYGRQMKEIAAAMDAFTQEDIARLEKQVETGAFELALPSGTVSVEKEDVTITSQDMPGWLIAVDGTLTLALDVTITPALQREGTARELVNRIQNLRKESGLEVTDKINVVVESRPEVVESLQDYSEYIAGQTLASSIQTAAHPHLPASVEWDEGTLAIHIEKS